MWRRTDKWRSIVQVVNVLGAFDGYNDFYVFDELRQARAEWMTVPAAERTWMHEMAYRFLVRFWFCAKSHRRWTCPSLTLFNMAWSARVYDLSESQHVPLILWTSLSHPETIEPLLRDVHEPAVDFDVIAMWVLENQQMWLGRDFPAPIDPRAELDLWAHVLRKFGGEPGSAGNHDLPLDVREKTRLEIMRQDVEFEEDWGDSADVSAFPVRERGWRAHMSRLGGRADESAQTYLALCKRNRSRPVMDVEERLKLEYFPAGKITRELVCERLAEYVQTPDDEATLSEWFAREFWIVKCCTAPRMLQRGEGLCKLRRAHLHEFVNHI